MDAAGTSGTLIICPLSCVGNWVAELRRFSPGLPVVRYHGSAEAREALRGAHVPAGGFGRAPGAAVFVTSYDIALRDEGALAGAGWRTLVIDEGHKLKNESGVIRRALQSYAAPRAATAQVRMLLTGTPVQNDMVELWSLCNFIMPGVFSSKDEFSRIYTFMGLGTAAGGEYIKAQERKNAIVTKLHALLSRYMLRRTKAQVALLLPPKVEALVYAPLAREQARILRAIAAVEAAAAGAPAARGGEAAQLAAPSAEAVSQALAGMGWRCTSGAGALGAEGAAAARVSTHNRTMNLRKVCNHPYLFAEPADALPGATDGRIVSCCGKMVVLDKMLRRLRADGHKVLIFSQFVTMLDILADYYAWAGEDAVGQVRMLTGQTPAEERDAAVAEFENDPDNRIGAFLLSTRAGGLGINLSAADTVIFYDSDWKCVCKQPLHDRARAQTSAMSCPLRARGPTYFLRAIL